jgi:hypothetical protein
MFDSPTRAEELERVKPACHFDSLDIRFARNFDCVFPARA